MGFPSLSLRSGYPYNSSLPKPRCGVSALPLTRNAHALPMVALFKTATIIVKKIWLLNDCQVFIKNQVLPYMQVLCNCFASFNFVIMCNNAVTISRKKQNRRTNSCPGLLYNSSLQNKVFTAITLPAQFPLSVSLPPKKYGKNLYVHGGRKYERLPLFRLCRLYQQIFANQFLFFLHCQ